MTAKKISSRNTKQRTIILQILKSKKVPVSAVEILSLAQYKMPDLNKTTVYRTLDRLEGEGLVVAVHLESGIVHYELSQDKNHHHHFVCDLCTSIYCLEGCPEELKSMLPPGFIMSGHEVTLRGTCSKCQLSKKQKIK